jgi:hypothetical protein
MRYNSTDNLSMTRRSSNTQEAQSLLKTMVREIRSMEPSSTGSYPIESAGSTTVTFFYDTNGDGLRERIRYYLSGSNLQRGQIVPSGNPITYNPANEQTKILATGLKTNGGPLFEYHNSNYTGTSSPLTYPLNIPTIRLVKINLTIDSDPNKSPFPRTFSSQAALRNLKDNL